MRPTIYAAAASFALALMVGQAEAIPVDHSIAVPTNVEQTQFIFGGRNYCWYDGGWRGPGYYWCGYAWRRGLGWGGGAGWHGWHGGHDRVVVGRPGRPDGGRPGERHGDGHQGGHDHR